MSVRASPDNPFASREPAKVYSVPRRYDLATLMAVTLAYAVLFGTMRSCGAPPAAIGFVSLFVTLVGLGQALLFRGRNPRRASTVAGALAFLVCGIVSVWMSSHSRMGDVVYWTDTVLVLATGSLCPGMIFGYVVGTLVAGVFLVADLFRKLLRRLSSREFVSTTCSAETTEAVVGQKESGSL